MRSVTTYTAGLSLALGTLTGAQEAIELDQTLTGRLEEGDATAPGGQWQDAYTFDANAGQEIVIHVHSAEVDTILAATDASGQALENDDFGSTREAQVTLTAAADGPVAITVRSYLPQTEGSYVISVRGGGEASTLRGMAQTDAQFISIGQTIPGRLEPGDGQLNSGEYRDGFYFDGQAGDEITIDLQSTEFDPYLILIPPVSAQIDNDDAAAGDTLDSQISLRLPDTGEYRLLATSYAVGETGSYTITLSPGLSGSPTSTGIEPADSVALFADQPHTGELGAGDEVFNSGELFDVYTFENDGRPFKVTLASSAFDTYLIVIDPQGRQFDNDDASGGTLDSQLMFSTAEAGTYTILASSYATGVQGPYEVLVSGGGLASPVAGPPSTGTPTQPAPMGPGELALNDSGQGSLDQGDATLQSGEYIDWFEFQGQVGQQVTFALESTVIDPYLIVISPSGQQQDNDDVVQGNLNSAITMTLPETGAYRVGATSYAVGMVGPYTVGVHEGAYQVAGPQPFVPTVSPTRTYYGLFCGISDYLPAGPGGSDLPLCASDATKLHDTMVETGVMQPENIITLTDTQATRQALLDAFADLSARIDEDDVFVFFYSGHGGQGDPGSDPREADQMDEYLFLADSESLTDDELATLFDGIPAEISVVCLDSCFSGGFSKDVIVQPRRLGLFSSEEDLTSSVAGKFQAGGYLSHFFVTGVAGDADNDPTDSQITVGELCHYLQTMFAQNVIAEESSTNRDTRGYQHLVVDRGGVKVEEILIAR